MSYSCFDFVSSFLNLVALVLDDVQLQQLLQRLASIIDIANAKNTMSNLGTIVF
jgi:hypothetical protein